MTDKADRQNGIIDNLEIAQDRILSASGHSLIDKPKILPVTLRRLRTANGVGQTQGVKVGARYLVHLDSLRAMEVTDKQGYIHIMPVINRVNEFGKDLGYVFAELFFD